MSNDNQTEEPRPSYYSFQNEIANQAVKGLLVINGGATLALLAFLQSVWDENISMARCITVAIGVFCLGLTFAAASNFFRYFTSQAYQRKIRRRFLVSAVSNCVQWASLACFVAGVLTVIVGVLVNLEASK